jgi:hypothetical protein
MLTVLETAYGTVQATLALPTTAVTHLHSETATAVGSKRSRTATVASTSSTFDAVQMVTLPPRHAASLSATSTPAVLVVALPRAAYRIDLTIAPASLAMAMGKLRPAAAQPLGPAPPVVAIVHAQTYLSSVPAPPSVVSDMAWPVVSCAANRRQEQLLAALAPIRNADEFARVLIEGMDADAPAAAAGGADESGAPKSKKKKKLVSTEVNVLCNVMISQIYSWEVLLC